MDPGATIRNVVVGVFYVILLPLVIVVAPFYLLVAVGTNRNGLADVLADSPLGLIPPIRSGGWRAGLTLCLVGLVCLGTLGVLVPVDASVGSVLGGDVSVETTDNSENETPADGESESNTNSQDDTGPDESTSQDQSESGTGTNDGDEQSDPDNDTAPIPSGTLEIHHIDVGQADSTLLITPRNETILIDTGDWQDEGETVIEYLDRLGIERIDHLIGTHPHADHIGGHAESIAHYEQAHDGIGNIYDSGVPHDTETYAEYLDAVEEYNHELRIVEEGDELPLDSDTLSARVFNPTSDREGSIHHNSIALVFEFGEVRYLITGDAESATEQRLTAEWREELSADIYQAGHQGSATSSTRQFLTAVDPSVAVVSSARDSQFGHPHDEVLERFAEMDIETYWTGVHGDVVIETDGRNVTVETNESFPTDPLALLDAKQNNSARFELDSPTMYSNIGSSPVQSDIGSSPVQSGIGSSPVQSGIGSSRVIS